ncbi:FAST kinase domain-containing protein 5, mitochondrial isoform X2 [Cimex lectularius]|uniref:Uncharacterized protein n=1 Tax=Cimex lectularius TaxID=79782 RepID=A0A8I6R8Z3_CIMLE|nr:FAST kinase domain-containing protein 5, mitochondrial isoform X2 [Cimex lectularius]
MAFRTIFIRQFCLNWRCRSDPRSLSTSALTTCLGRVTDSKFIPRENNFSHQVLEKMGKYCLAELPKFDEAKAVESPNEVPDWKAMTIQQLCDKVEAMSHEAHKSSLDMDDPRFKSMFQAVKERSAELDDDQLAGLISNIALWPFVNSVIERGFHDYWKALDERCMERRTNWDTKKLLYFIDLWYFARLARPSDFVYLAIKKLTNKADKLDAQAVVQVLFYLNTLRTVMTGVSIYDLEHRLLEVFNTLTIEEIGVALMGFFKTKHVLHNHKLMTLIFERLREQASTIPEVTLAAILKALRLSLTYEVFDQVPPTLDVLEKEISRLSVTTCVHVSLLVSRGLTFHQGSLTKIAQKLVDNITDARLKDIEKVIYPLVLVSFDPHTYPCIFETVMNELQNPKREEEIETHPKTYVALLHYLSIRNFVLEPLIAKVLDENFILKVYGKVKFNIGREILCLDTFVRLQCPNYKGPKLNEKTRNYLSKRYSQPIQANKPSKHMQYFMDVQQTLEAMVGKNYACKYLLPNHPRADMRTA